MKIFCWVIGTLWSEEEEGGGGVPRRFLKFKKTKKFFFFFFLKKNKRLYLIKIIIKMLVGFLFYLFIYRLYFN